MYQTLEAMSREWEQSDYVEDSKDQMGAFSREIATWICNQDGPFTTVDLQNMMMSTNRPINRNLLQKVAKDVNETVERINQMSTFPGDNSLTVRIGQEPLVLLCGKLAKLARYWNPMDWRPR